jgi:peptide deformylase
MRLEIVLWPDPVLLAGSRAVKQGDPDLRAVVGEMRRVMFELRGVGLAAPQVGVAKRLMLVCPSGVPGDDVVVVNPTIVAADGEEIGEEGCLSFPGIFGRIRRAQKIRVRYRDLDWREKDLELDGFVARIYQHESDHLDGKVFIDRMEPEDRREVEKDLEELKKRFAARV